MKTMKHIFYFALLSYVLIGCSKEEDFKTQGELIQDEINQKINEYDISLCNVYFYQENDGHYFLGNIETEFDLKQGILIIGNYNYNLEKLRRWRYIQSGDTYFIDFYF